MKLIVALLFVVSFGAHAQDLTRITADTVLRFTPGSGQSTGQGPAFFPSNIFGIPDPTATEETPSVDPREVCSIGLNGEIIIGFVGHVIVDAPGPDFTVFENVFIWNEGRYYREPARVEVSTDGITWTAFPIDTLSLIGCAGRLPTTGGDPFDASVSGGDLFDLAEISVDSIRWIKLTDVSRIILDNPQHPDYDPTLSGFDLDAVVSNHGVRVVHQAKISVVPRTSTVVLEVPAGSAQFDVFDVAGNLLWKEDLQSGVHVRSLDFLAVTVAFARLQSNGELLPVRVLR